MGVRASLVDEPTRRHASSSLARAARRHLQQLLLSPDFDASRRSRDFLCLIVEETLAGRAEGLSQAAIATRVFGRRDDFDPLIDPIVRIQAGRLRRSLERYYLLAGKQDPVRIELPRGTYVPAFRKVAETEAAAPAERRLAAVEAGDAWPRVEVCPFEGVSGTEPEDIRVHLTEDLAAELGRYGDARVVLGRDEHGGEAAGPKARFELRGRLRPEGEGWLVSARLADRTSGEQLWADAYRTGPSPGGRSATPADVACVIAARVGAENGAVVQALARAPTQPLQAATGPYLAILASYRFFFTREVRDLAPAVEALRRVVAEEPQQSLAWTQLARLYLANHAFELSNLPTPLDDAIAHAHPGVRLNPVSARARCVLAAALLVKGELTAGRAEVERALLLNPGSLVYLEVIGWLTALLGDWERGIGLVRDAMERNPHSLPHVYHGLWADHVRRGEFDQAYQAALRYRDPTFFWRSLMLASCLGQLGRLDEARVAVSELLRSKPDFEARGLTLIGYYLKPVEIRERVVEGLRKAGLLLA